MVKYDAFISYRHAEKDIAVAEKLHRVLETYRIPNKLAKKFGKKSISRVFRDRDELPTSSNLSDNINQALENSEYLIVICSPKTPGSIWVRKEIETFIKLHGYDRVLALLIEGEPADSFPPELLTLPDGTAVEPLAADIRAETKREAFKLLKIEKLRLLSALIGCRYDDLKQRHRERVIRNILSLAFALSAFFMVFAGVVLFQNHQIALQRAQAQRGQSLFLSFLSGQILADGDRKMATMLALEALPKNLKNHEKPFVEEAQYALTEALFVYRNDSGFHGDFSVKHRRGILFTTVSPDFTKLLTVGDDNVIAVWDFENGNEIIKIPYQGRNTYFRYRRALFSPDSRMLVSNIDEGVLRAWDIETGEIVWSFAGLDDAKIYNSVMAVGKDGESVFLFLDVISSYDATIYEIDTATGTIISTRVYDDGIDMMVVSENNRYLALVTNDDDFKVYDLETDELILSYYFGNEDEYTFSERPVFHSDESKILFSYSYRDDDWYTYHLKHYDLGSGELIFENIYHDDYIDNLDYSDLDFNYITFSSRREVFTLDMYGNEVFRITMGNTVTGILTLDTMMIISDADGNTSFYDTDDGWEHTSYRFKLPMGAERLGIVHGAVIASSTRSNQGFVVRMTEDTYHISYPRLPNFIMQIDISPEGTRALASVYDDYVYSIMLGSPETTPSKLPFEDIRKVYHIDEDNVLAVGSDVIYSYNLKERKLNNKFEVADQIFSRSSDISPDRSTFIYADGEILHIIDTLTLSEKATFDGSNFIREVNFDEKGKNVLVQYWGGSGRSVSLLDTTTWKALISWNIQDIRYFSVADDGRICLASDDEIYLFDRDFNPLPTPVLPLKVFAVSFSHFNQDLIVAMDRSYAVYDVNMELRFFVNVDFDIESFIYNPKEKLIYAQRWESDTYIINGESYKILSRIRRADAFTPDFTHFFYSSKNALTKKPVYTLEMLIEEAHRQLGGRTLTEEERHEFFLDE